MKNIVIAVSIAVFIFGCATSNDRITTGQEEAADAKPEKIKEPEESQPQKIAILTKATTFYGDGDVDVYTIYSYSEDDASLLSENLYNGADELLEEVSFSYGNGCLARKTTLNPEGKVKSYHIYTHNNIGLLESDTLYDKKDEVQTISKYEYDSAGNRKKWSIFNGAEALLGYSVYSFNNSKLIRTDIFSSNGDLEQYSTVEFNQNFQKIKIIFFTPPGELERYSQYSYEKDLLILESYFNSENKLLRQVKYGYDNQGSIIKIEHIDSGGKLKEIIKREYMYREQKS